MTREAPPTALPPAAIARTDRPPARRGAFRIVPVVVLVALLLLPAGVVGLGLPVAASASPMAPPTATPASHPSAGAALLAEAQASLAAATRASPRPSNSSVPAGWTELGAAAGQPPAQSAAALAYDPNLHEVVLFGGYDSAVAAYGQTWTFRNDTWTNITSNLSVAPAPRWEAGFAFDPSGGNMLLFGGRNVTQFFNDTWEFNGTAWWQLPLTVHPSARGLVGMASDPSLNAVLLFGGGTGNLPAGSYAGWVADNDTWMFQSGAWTNLTPQLSVSPPAAYSVGLAYVPDVNASGQLPNQTSRMVLLGGTSSGNTTSAGCAPMDQEWTYSATGGWTNVTASAGPLPDGALGLENMGMVWDAALNGIVVYGGIVGLPGCPSTDQTWLSNGTGWQNLTAFLRGPAPPGNDWLELAYDTDSGEVVMEGDNYNGYYQAATWVLNGTLGFAATITVTPSTGVAPLNVTLSASLLGGTAPYTYNWTLANGTDVNGTANTSEQFATPGVYTVMFTSWDAAGAAATATATIPVLNASSTFFVVASATPTNGPAPLNVSFSASVTPGTPPYTYLWTFGDGTNSTLAAPVHTFASAGVYATQLQVTDSTGGVVNGSVAVIVTAAPPFGLSVQALPSQGPAPLNVSFTATVSGATLPISYSWSFGDGGSSTVASPSHTYTVNGTYNATLTAVDAAGVVSQATVTIRVGAPPQVGTWYSVPSLSDPSTRSAPAMAYDPLLSAVVMFGGYGGPSVVALGDTWEYSNGSWTNVTSTLSTAPPARWEAAFVFDPVDGSLVLFGGRDVTQFFNDTWTFNASGWSKVTTPVAPSPRGLSAFTYDPSIGAIVLFGGGTGNLPAGSYAGWVFDNDTWEFQSGAWTNVTARLTGAPPAASSGALAYDPATGGDLLYGGTVAPNGCAIYSEQWSLQNGTWINQSAQALSGPGGAGGLESFSMVYDPALGGIVAFGGNTETLGTCLSTDQTWLYSGGNWTDLTDVLGTQTPDQRQGEGMTYDAADGYLLMFGGGAPGFVYLQDTWALVAGAAPLAPIPVSFQVTGGSGTGPQLVTFTAALGGTAAGATFYWVFGDGTSGAGGAQVTHLYALVGVFLPSVTIQLPDGRASTFHLPAVHIRASTSGAPSAGALVAAWFSGLFGWGDAVALVAGVLGGAALWAALDRRRERLRQEGLALVAPAEGPPEPRTGR